MCKHTDYLHNTHTQSEEIPYRGLVNTCRLIKFAFCYFKSPLNVGYKKKRFTIEDRYARMSSSIMHILNS